MKQYNVLVLTDHTNHSKENSIYALLRAMRKHPTTRSVAVATRANKANSDFFQQQPNAELMVSPVMEDFSFTSDGAYYQQDLQPAALADYDLIWLRMPPPLSASFLEFIDETFADQFVINHPKGILKAGSKEFLKQFPDLCPPTKICQSKADIIEFKNRFPVVLKPFREYGGRGIVKIDGDKVWLGKEEMRFDDFMKNLADDDIQYLGVKFLKNVGQGDKRIVVVNGKVMGASLRLPPEDSWICNVAMGGSAQPSDVEPAEYNIVESINPVLSEMGIVMYGVDTLVGDHGKRVLSEINSSSIGGLPQIAAMQNLPLVEEAIDLIWSYYLKNKKE